MSDVVAVVYDTRQVPVPGIVIAGFVVAFPCNCWCMVPATPADRHIPAPPSGDFGQPLSEIARVHQIQPVAAEHTCTLSVGTAVI